jgi:hypothetical protein
MTRSFVYVFAVVLLAFAQRMSAQAQVQVTVPPDKPAPAQTDSMIDADEGAASNSVSLNTWLTHRADELLDIVSCYLDKKSLKNELALEIKAGSDPVHLIEVRIKLLKTLASHNAASHCK